MNHRLLYRFLLLIGCLFSSAWPTVLAQSLPYPDELGYQQRIAGMIGRIAAQGYGVRSLANSTCPDTGLPVKTWAVEGEEIISPYTGRKYKQGPTGYFGPKSRDAQGRITSFGGDPLKYDLPPATAALLLDPHDAKARAFLSIPGNLSQQYHFAAKNWVRFYGLLGAQMGEAWQADFRRSIADYAESRRPSDGAREHNFLSKPHNLVGEAGELLGGNKKDGGTENHKVMWRTSGLLYSQWFPDTARISGMPAAEAKVFIYNLLEDYLRRLLRTGNGEYDSQIYYPHSILPFLNLYDLSPDPKTRELASILLDYYVATYGLKVVDGAFAGAQKRGFLTSTEPNEMRSHLWAWFDTSPGSNPRPVSSIQQATSGWRPNGILFNIVHKNIPLPFESRMARPSYHMDLPNTFQEYFYASHSFSMGSVAMTMVDNPTQQVVWSLVARGKNGPLSFGAMQPKYLNPAGHSPYSQTMQHKGTLLILTAPTNRAIQVVGRALTSEEQIRLQHAEADLTELPVPEVFTPESLEAFLQQAPQSAATWFFAPHGAGKPQTVGNWQVFDLDSTWVAVYPIGQAKWLPVSPEMTAQVSGKKGDIFKEFAALVASGKVSGFVVEAVEKRQTPSLDALSARLAKAAPVVEQPDGQRVSYRTLQGDQLEMYYQPAGLRADGTINGKPLDYQKWANGAVYDNPFVRVKEGKMTITDGKNGYEVYFEKGKWVKRDVR